MSTSNFPENLTRLHQDEEELYLKSMTMIERTPQLLLHVQIVESVMDMLYILSQFPTDDEDFKLIQILGIRLFNAFAASIRLVLAGYYQKGAMIMRDILETVFLVDLFRTDWPAIARWRHADKKNRLKEFRPVAVREALDKRDGLKNEKRAAIYGLLSELAAHASMQSTAMLRPKGMDAHTGPFLDPTALEAALYEMGRLAVQAGEIFGLLFPAGWTEGQITFEEFNKRKKQWLDEFYSSLSK